MRIDSLGLYLQSEEINQSLYSSMGAIEYILSQLLKDNIATLVSQTVHSHLEMGN